MILDWYDENTGRDYPFVQADVAQLPFDFIVDCGFVIRKPSAEAARAVVITQVTVTGAGVELELTICGRDIAVALAKTSTGYEKVSGYYVAPAPAVGEDPEEDYGILFFFVVGTLPTIDYTGNFAIEPSCLTVNEMSRFSSISIANDYYVLPPACDDTEFIGRWPLLPTDESQCDNARVVDVNVVARDLESEVTFVPGVQIAIDSDSLSNSIVFSTTQLAAGCPFPDAESWAAIVADKNGVPLDPDTGLEVPYADAFPCNDPTGSPLLFTINGRSPVNNAFRIAGTRGITISTSVGTADEPATVSTSVSDAIFQREKCDSADDSRANETMLMLYPNQEDYEPGANYVTIDGATIIEVFVLPDELYSLSAKYSPASSGSTLSNINITSDIGSWDPSSIAAINSEELYGIEAPDDSLEANELCLLTITLTVTGTINLEYLALYSDGRRLDRT